MKLIKKLFLVFVFFSFYFLVFSSPVSAAAVTSNATGNWSASAWPNTNRTGTVTCTTSSATVTGSSTLFTTELNVVDTSGYLTLTGSSGNNITIQMEGIYIN